MRTKIPKREPVNDIGELDLDEMRKHKATRFNLLHKKGYYGHFVPIPGSSKDAVDGGLLIFVPLFCGQLDEMVKELG